MPETTPQSELLHRLDKVPRAAWKRFATYFKQLVHCPEVSATKSPVQNVREVCDSISMARPTTRATKQRTKRRTRTRRRRRWIIPKWVIDFALAALIVGGVMKLGNLIFSSTARRFCIVAYIHDAKLHRDVRDYANRRPHFQTKNYPLHITLVSGECDVRDLEYISDTVLKDVRKVVKNEVQPTFTLRNRVEPNYGTGGNTIVATIDVDKSTLLGSDLETKWEDDLRNKWEQRNILGEKEAKEKGYTYSPEPRPKVTIVSKYHVTLGTISTLGLRNQTTQDSILTELTNIVERCTGQTYPWNKITIDKDVSYIGYK